MSREAPDEAAWKEAEKSARLAQQQAAEASRTAGERNKKLETREEHLSQRAQALLPAQCQTALPKLEELFTAEMEQSAALRSAMKKEKDANVWVERAKVLSETIPERERLSAQENDRLAALDREIISRKASMGEKYRQAEELRQTLPYKGGGGGKARWPAGKGGCAAKGNPGCPGP